MSPPRAQATQGVQDPPRGALICTDYSPRGPPPWGGSCRSPAQLLQALREIGRPRGGAAPPSLGKKRGTVPGSGSRPPPFYIITPEAQAPRHPGTYVHVCMCDHPNPMYMCVHVSPCDHPNPMYMHVHVYPCDFPNPMYMCIHIYLCDHPNSMYMCVHVTTQTLCTCVHTSV